MLLRQIEARLEGKSPAPVRYQWLPLKEAPRDFVRCVLTSEDQRFFKHQGFDWDEVRRAKEDAKRRGKAPRGASTITMQCARSTFLWQGRSYVRKGLEVYYTFWMELLLSKQRILELYVNVIEMGDGVYGLAAASEYHFRIPPKKITREQCALLTAILPNPRQRDPRNPAGVVATHSKRVLAREPFLKVPYPP